MTCSSCASPLVVEISAPADQVRARMSGDAQDLAMPGWDATFRLYLCTVCGYAQSPFFPRPQHKLATIAKLRVVR